MRVLGALAGPPRDRREPHDHPHDAMHASRIARGAAARLALLLALAPALAAAQKIDQATITTLLTDKTNTAALTKAVGEVSSGLNITPAQAQARIADLATIPTAQLLLLQTSGQKVVNAQASLVALGKVPPADLAFRP